MLIRSERRERVRFISLERLASSSSENMVGLVDVELLVVVEGERRWWMAELCDPSTREFLGSMPPLVRRCAS